MSSTSKLAPADNALDSLNRMADEIGSVRAEAPASLKGALFWGWHAVALLAYARLLPARDRLDVWLRDYLEQGEAGLEVDRDARWEERQRLSLLELIDILSEVDLPLLKPEFYQGWQDRTTRCQTLRAEAARIVGSSIGEEHRRGLVLLLAAYHRVLRLPATVELDPRAVIAALPSLLDLAETLVDRSAAESTDLLDALRRCREAHAGG